MLFDGCPLDLAIVETSLTVILESYQLKFQYLIK